MRLKDRARKYFESTAHGRGTVVMIVGVAVYFLGGLLHHYIALLGWLIGIIGFVVFARSAFSPKLHQAELENLKEKQPWDS